MYEQFDGLRKFKGDFSPCPETMDFYVDVILPAIGKIETPETNYIPKTPVENGCNRTNKNEDPETKTEEVKPETGLTVTNSVNYEIKDREKTGLFKRR